MTTTNIPTMDEGGLRPWSGRRWSTGSRRRRLRVRRLHDHHGAGLRVPGTGRHLLLVEPDAGAGLEQKLKPFGRTYDGLSTVICTPGSPAQKVGLGLGAQPGARRLAILLGEAGFSHVPRATETPFNITLESRS